MKTRLLIIILTVSLSFAVIAPQAFALCVVNEDWPEAPCLDSIGNGWYDQDQVDRWSDYYSYKGPIFMEAKYLELTEAINEDRIEEWTEESVENRNVYEYYFFSGRAPNTGEYHGRFNIIPINDESPASYQLDEPFEIKMDQRIRFEDLALHFYDVEDSRCPLDVTCIWEGNVTVMINIQNQTHKIGGMFPPGYTISYLIPYEITLVDIQPHPISTEEADYVATLEISKLPDRESLQKGETLGDSAAILGWAALASFLFIVAAYIIMKIKKRK